MSTSTMDIRDLDRQNLLTMPSTRLQPGATYLLIYKASWDNIGTPSMEQIQAALDKSPDLYGVPPVVPIDKCIGVPCRMRTKPQSTVVEAVAQQIKTLHFPFKGSLSLTHLLPREVMQHGSTTFDVANSAAARDAVGRVVAVAKQSPAQRSDPLGIRAGTDKVTQTVSRVLGTAKWVSIGIIGIVLVFLFLEFKKAKGAAQL